MSLKEFDKSTVRGVIDDMEAALAEVALKHGIKLKRKGCSYRANQCPVPFEFHIERVAADGNVETPESETYKLRCGRYGLKPEWLFQRFTNYAGKRMQVVGLKPRRRKYPVLVEADDGKRYKMTAAEVQGHMERKDAEVSR